MRFSQNVIFKVDMTDMLKTNGPKNFNYFEMKGNTSLDISDVNKIYKINNLLKVRL